MARKKTAAELIAAGAARSKVAKARSLESMRHVLGEPPRPQGKIKSWRNLWSRIAAPLLAARKLAMDDGDRLTALVDARQNQRIGTDSEREAARVEAALLLKAFEDREPFPEQAAPTPVEVSSANLADFLAGVKAERDTFAARLTDGTVCLDESGSYEWPEGDAATIARQYALDGTQGGIVVGELVRHACARFLKDLEDGAGRGLFFDPWAARNAKRFFDDFITEWKLQPWQTLIIANIFGWKRATGYRRFRWVWLATGRKNGKSSFLAGIGMQQLVADLATRCEVYSAATKRDQAKIVHGDGRRIVKLSPQLNLRVRTFVNSLNVEEDDAVFQALASDSHTMDGLRPQCALLDEIHEHPSDAVTKRLQSGTLNRPQPLLISATTAGQDRGSWCYSQHELFEQHLRGTLCEPSYWDERFVFIAMCDEKDDPADEAVWVKANPNLGISVDLDGLRSQAAEFKNDPQALFSFQRFHLNIWNSVVTGHSLPQDKIAACGGTFPDKEAA